MSFPEHISSTSLTFLDPNLLITNLDWLYLLSMKETDGLSEKYMKNEEVCGFDAYLDFVDFTRATYMKLRQDYFIKISQSSRLLTENLINNKNEYFSRASMMLNKINKNKKEKPLIMVAYQKCAYEVFKQCQGVSNCSALQSNPQRWPWGLEDFYKSLSKQDQLSLFYEPDCLRQQIDQNLMRLQRTSDHKSLLKTLIEYALRVGTFKQIISLCDLNVKEIVKLPRIVPKDQHLHYMRSLCDQGGFTIAWLQQFTKLSYHQVTMTSSQAYLFVLISSPIGGMFKIGTGECGTIAGKVYLHVPQKKQDDVQWVYLQNKLYLKQSNGTLDIVCPETLTVISQMTLHCPELFQHPQMQAINKNFPLITDGEKLFIIGRKLNIIKTEGGPAKLKEPSASRTKKKEDQQPSDNTIKLMDFVLYEFDILKPSGNLQNEEESDKKLLSELYDSFQGYFTRAEISKALNLNKNDMQNAAQWLVEEGEKERNKTTVSVSKQTLLCQAEITTDISAKQVKSSADIGCKEGSILVPSIVSNIIWTMDSKYVTAYTEFGVKIFSKDPADESDLDSRKEGFSLRDHYASKKVEKQTIPLRGSYVKTIDKFKNEFYANPNYLVSYEQISKRFYVMHIQWSSVDLQFPALVTIGSDFVQKQQSIPQFPTNSFDDEVVNFLLQAQEHRYNQPWRLNDWHFAYLNILKNLNGIMDHFSDEEAKKIHNEKSKYIYRLNKIQVNQTYSEVKKTYAYCVEGTVEELQLIWHLFKKHKKIQYIHLLYYWVFYSEKTILLKKGAYDLLKEIGEYLIENITNDLQNSILVQGWPLFMSTNTLQLKYLKLDNQQLMKGILQTHSTIQPETESAIHKITAKTVKNDTDFSQLTNNIKVNAAHLLIEPLTRLLVPGAKCRKLFRSVFPKGFIDGENDVSLEFWIMAKEWAQTNDLTKWQLLELLFNLALHENNEWEVQHKLVFNILQVFEIGVGNKEVKELLLKSNMLSQFLLALFLQPVIQCPIDVSLLSILMQINSQIEQPTQSSRTQGVDAIGFKIFETSHPYERQKVQTFEDTYFPEALALMVDFDPRCSSDQAHDFLTINSWYSPHTGPLGVQTRLKDPMGVSYRISGKLSTRRPILMLGNVIQADFSPSGQARNEHSLNRWGFKITIRPVYGDTFHVSKILHMVILEHITSLLGFNVTRSQDEDSNAHLLKWNLLKNGRAGFQLDKQIIKVLGQISITPMPYEDATFLHEGASATKVNALKKIFSYKQREIVKPQVNIVQLVQQTNCQSYIQQIMSKQGEFYKLAEELIGKFGDSSQYKTAKYKNAMKPHLDEYRQVEMLLILAILYHSGLLGEVNLQHLELDMLREARNEVINYMLQEVDVITEFQQNYEGMMLQATEMMEQQKSKLNEKMENILWDMLQQRLEGNNEMIYKICTYISVGVVENNPNQSLRAIYNHIMGKIRAGKLDLVNPYQDQATKVKERILALFLISNTPLVGQQQVSQARSSSVDSGSVKLRPPGLERSVSHQIDEKHIDGQKLLKFRQWLDSYQKWKVLHNVGQVSAESLHIPPVKSIILFVKQKINNSLIAVMDLHNRRCVRRVAALRFLNEFQYSGGQLCQDVLNHKIEFASSNVKELLLQEVVRRLNYLMQSIKSDYASFLQQAINQQIDFNILEQLKSICMTLCEINQLFQVDNNILWKSREHDYNPHFNPIFKQFLKNIIQTGLLSLAFINLDQQYQSVAALSQSILNNVKETLLIVTDNLMSDDVLQILINVLALELGINEEHQINCRLLAKLHDLIGVRRVNFILTHILDVLLCHQQINIPTQLTQLIFIILYHTNTPTTMRLAVRIAKYLSVDDFTYTPSYFWTSYENGIVSQTCLQTLKLPFLDSLVERVGKFSEEGQQLPIQNQILQEVTNIQKKNSDPTQYRVILHLCQEEEISILLKILYWWEELYPNLKLKLPTTYQEYLDIKDKEKKREEQKSQQQEVIAQQTEFQNQRQQQQQQYKLLERVLMTFPEVQLPYLLGWGFNYSNIFGDMKSTPSENKKHSSGRVKKQIKKYWRPLNFQELERLYDELYKQNDDIKSFPNEQAFLKQRNFITRIHSHLREIKNYGSLLTVYGCISFNEVFTYQKASVLIELIQAALNGTLPPIPLTDLSEDFKNKADPNKYILIGPIKEVTPAKGKSQQQKVAAQIPPQATSGKSQMTVSLCDVHSFQSFEFRMDYITLLPYGNTSVNFYNEINRSSSFTQQVVSGQVVGQLIFELSQLLTHKIKKINRTDRPYLYGLATVMAQKLTQIAPGMPVQIKRHKSQHYVIAGGEASGQKNVSLIGSNDDRLNLQVVKLEEVELLEEPHSHQLTHDQLIQLILAEQDKFMLRNLLILAQQLDWKNHDVTAVIDKVLSLATTSSQTNKFIQSWERLIDSKIPPSYFFPQEIVKTIKFLEASQAVVSEDCKIEPFIETVDNTIIVGSAYLSSLPEACVVSNELKLVQYWEKNILPKIYDYVKGSLRQYEIEDFFEQIRQQLRKGDQPKALEISYIVCDQRMPNGVVIPEANHDWGTLTIEEVQAGQFVLCRLVDKNSDQLYSKEYIHYKKQGLQFICGQIIGVDQRSSSVLVTHMDVSYCQQYATWFPVSSLKQVQLYMNQKANAFQQETILKEYNKELESELSKQARSLYSLMSQNVKVDPFTYLQLTMNFEGSCVNGWLTEYVIDEHTQINSKLEQILKTDSIFEWLQKQFENVASFVHSNKLILDLVKTHKKPQELNSDTTIAGLAIVFKNDATLCTCSGINFYKDKLGIDDFYTLTSGKETRGRLPPLILNQSQVYCEYYFNGEALPIYQQKSCASRLPCVVYKIPSLWNTLCYAIDQMGTIYMKEGNLENLRRINQLIESAFQNQPHILAQSLIKLLMRNMRKLSTLSKESLNEKLLQTLIADAVKLHSIQKVEPNVLFSSYLQDLTELIAVSQVKENVPEWLHAYMQLTSIAEFIKGGKPLPAEQIEEMRQLMNNNPLDKLLYMEGLPCDVMDVLQSSNVRVLNPAIDVLKQGDQMIVLIDGFSTLDVESDVVLPPEPVEEAVKYWQCEVCTFAENVWDSSQCVVCENPAPSVKIPYKAQGDEEVEVEQQVNVNEEDEKAEKREKQRLEELLGKLKDKVKGHYEEQLAQREKKIAQLKTQIESHQLTLKQLNKQLEKKRKSKSQTGSAAIATKIAECGLQIQELQQEIEKIKEVKLENNFALLLGKQSLEKSFVSEFLDARLKHFKQQDWKTLEQTGYDLHCQLVNKQQIEILPLPLMKQLLKLIEFDICKETKAVRTYKPSNIRVEIDENALNYQDYQSSLPKYQDLLNSPIHMIRQSWAIIRLFNRYLEMCGQFINMDVPIGTTQQFKEKQTLLSMGNYMQVLRNLCMTPTKVDIVQRVLNKTAISRDSPPKVNVERIKMAGRSQQEYLFTMAYEQMKNIPPTLLRPIRPQGTDPFLAFEVNFKGEDVQGESGPYRQFFADISKELQQSQLLLYPSTNNQAKMGNHKDKFVLNPSAKSNYHLRLYEFLGVLMAIAIRTATHFSLDLPFIFWKQIVGEKIQIEDIEQIDATMCSLINFMQECPQQTFEENIFENWVTLRTDGGVQELKEDGSQIPVKYEDRLEYISKLLNVKCTESEVQCENLIKGLITIIPSPLLNCNTYYQAQGISAEDLELWVCGRPIVDVELLKRHTRYSGELNEKSQRIQFFWNALQELTEPEKLRFIKFCWGQERLPANDEEFDRNQIRFMIKPSTHQSKDPNKVLPKADTCFFNLELPNYSSKEILKKNLLTAINFDCDSMNADPRVNLDPNARHRRHRDEDEDDSIFEDQEW